MYTYSRNKSPHLTQDTGGFPDLFKKYKLYTLNHFIILYHNEGKLA